MAVGIGAHVVAPASMAASSIVSASATSLGREGDHADPVEHEGDRAGLGEAAAGLGEGRTHVGGRAVAVVGLRLDDERGAAGP